MTSVRYILRTLFRDRGHLTILVLSLGLAIGANTAIFSLVEAVLLQPFPFKDTERLVLLWASKDFDVRRGISGPDLNDLRAQNTVFEDLAGFIIGERASLDADAGGQATVSLVQVQPHLFRLLGVVPYRGRDFVPGEDETGGRRVAIISHGLWQSRFGGRGDLIGKDIRVKGVPYTVVGVMSPGFFFPDRDSQLWIPLSDSPGLNTRGVPLVHGLARLKAGANLQQATIELDITSQQLERAYPDSNKGVRLSPFPLLRVVVGEHGTALWLLLGATGMVLVMACANVTHLLLAKAAARKKEMAIRAALGASRPHIWRQLVLESTVLAVLGGVAGLLLAHGTLALVRQLNLADIPRITGATLSPTVLGFTLVVALGTGILIGLAPAWAASRTNLNQTLKLGGTTSGHSERNRFRYLLVLLQTALAMVLLSATALLLNSFVRIARSDWGIRPEAIVMMDVALPPAWEKSVLPKIQFTDAVLARLRSLPEVESVAVTHGVPGRWGTWTSTFLMVDGKHYPVNPAEGNSLHSTVATWVVGSGYFRTMGIPVLRGREFLPPDEHPGSSPVILVSKALAERLWPGQDPVGKRVNILRPKDEIIERLQTSPHLNQKLAADPDAWEFGPLWEVVGEVGNVRSFGLKTDAPPALYVNYHQQKGVGRPSQKFVVRLAQESATLPETLKSLVEGVDRGAVTNEVAYMEDIISQTVGGRGSRKLLMVITLAFTALALTLALIGVYGIVSHSCWQRSRETAVRLALGATKLHILRALLIPVSAVALFGVFLGTAACFVTTKVLAAYLFQVSPQDPLTLILSALTIVMTCLLAAYIPAYQATKTDVAVILRHE